MSRTQWKTFTLGFSQYLQMMPENEGRNTWKQALLGNISFKHVPADKDVQRVKNAVKDLPADGA
jgi:hypothetical protein